MPEAGPEGGVSKPGLRWPTIDRARKTSPPGWWLAVALLAALPAAGQAEVRQVTLCSDTVPGGAPGELRHAILNSNPGDLILVPACRITLQGSPVDLQSGSLDVS